MKRLLIVLACVMIAGQAVCLAQRKNDAFNVYLDMSFGMNANDREGSWAGNFRGNDLRLEIKGEVNSHLNYRMRYQLNKSGAPYTVDNLSRALDLMMVGWKFNPHWMIQGGKVFEMWGGFEYDENPIYVYEFCDQNANLDCFCPGAILFWLPVPGHEFAFSVTNTHTADYSSLYKPAALPLTYVLAWNGTLFGGLVSTRWGAGAHVFAQGQSSWRAFLGTKLNTKFFQCYLDLMGSWESQDYLRIVYEDLGSIKDNVRYLSALVRADWQFASHWNLMVKARVESADVCGDAVYSAYRLSFGSITSLEYRPLDSQEFLLFLARYCRHKVYSAASGLPGTADNMVQLGFKYRLKAY